MKTLERVCEVLDIEPQGMEQIVQRADFLAGLPPAVAFAILQTKNGLAKIRFGDPVPEVAAPAVESVAADEGPPEELIKEPYTHPIEDLDLDADVLKALLAAGVETLADVAAHPDLTEINGIGPATRQKLLARVRA